MNPIQHRMKDERGAVLVEHLVIVSVCLLVMVGLVTIGPRTVENYAAQRAALHQPAP